jgi:hypothetical protein
MDYREANELPAWAKLVNRAIRGDLTLEDLSPSEATG